MHDLGSKLRESGRALASVFSNPGLRRVQLAFVGSIVGDWAYAIAVAVYAYDQGGPAAVGLLGVVRYLSMALVLPLASTLADRYPRKWVMLVSDVVRAALVLAAAGVIAADGPSLAVYGLAIVTALVGTCFRPAQAALLPGLARDPGELTAANVASSTIESVGFFLGPALGGLLLAVADIQAVYVVNAATFLWSAAIIVGLHAPPVAPAVETAGGERGTFLDNASAGFRAILGNRDLRLVIGVYCAQTVVAGASLVFVVTLALDLLDLGRSGVGYLDAVMGIGGLVGGFVALLLAQRGRLALDFGLGVLLWSAPLLAIAAWPTRRRGGRGHGVDRLRQLPCRHQRLHDSPADGARRGHGSRVRGDGERDHRRHGRWRVGDAALDRDARHSRRARRARRRRQRHRAAGADRPAPIDVTALAPAGLELVRRISIFTALPEPILERLARALERVDAAAGELVIREGDEGDRFYAIEEGTVVVSKEGRWVAQLGPGDYFGEIALLKDVPRTATVTAETDVKLYALERDVFIPAVTGHHDVQEVAETAMATRLAML